MRKLEIYQLASQLITVLCRTAYTGPVKNIMNNFNSNLLCNKHINHQEHKKEQYDFLEMQTKPSVIWKMNTHSGM